MADQPLLVRYRQKGELSQTTEQIIIMVVFGLMLAYMMYGGGTTEVDKNGSRIGSRDDARNRRSGQPDPEHQAATPTGSQATMPSTAGSARTQFEESEPNTPFNANAFQTATTQQSQQYPNDWDAPPLKSPQIPAKRVLRKRSSQFELDRGETAHTRKVSFAGGEDGTPVTGSIATPHDGPADGEGYNSQKAKDELPKWMTDKRVYVNVEEWTALKLFGRMNLAKERMDDLLLIQKCAEMDLRGLEKNQQTGKAWEDSWHADLGVLPTRAMMAAAFVAELLPDDTFAQVAAIMEARQSKCEQKGSTDHNRDFGRFLGRIGVVIKDNKIVGGLPSKFVLLLGWFADTYRSVSYAKRMSVAEEPIPMSESLGVIATALKWMQALGKLFLRQRIFTESGADLAGQAVRLACPCTVYQSGKRTYAWELSIFMWSASEGETVRDWVNRLQEGAAALSSAMPAVMSALYLWADYNDQNAPRLANGHYQQDYMTRRRVVFRPGWRIEEIRESMTVNRSTVFGQKLDRQAKTIVLPPHALSAKADVFRGLNPAEFDGQIRSIFALCHPSEISIFNLRQHQWAGGLTRENSMLQSLQIAVILRGCGESLRLTHEGEVRTITTDDAIQQIDMAAVVPLIQVPASGPDSQAIPFTERFVPLTPYKGLKTLYIPYVPRGNKGATCDLTLVESYGLRIELAQERTGGVVNTPLTLVVTTSGRAELARFKQDCVYTIVKRFRQRGGFQTHEMGLSRPDWDVLQQVRGACIDEASGGSGMRSIIQSEDLDWAACERDVDWTGGTLA